MSQAEIKRELRRCWASRASRREHGGIVWWRELGDRQIQAQFAELGRGLHGRPDLATRAEPDVARQDDLRGITPDVPTVGEQGRRGPGTEGLNDQVAGCRDAPGGWPPGAGCHHTAGAPRLGRDRAADLRLRGTLRWCLRASMTFSWRAVA